MNETRLGDVFFDKKKVGFRTFRGFNMGKGQEEDNFRLYFSKSCSFYNDSFTSMNECNEFLSDSYVEDNLVKVDIQNICKFAKYNYGINALEVKQ